MIKKYKGLTREAYQQKIEDDPEWFIKDQLQQKHWSMMSEMMTSVFKKKRRTIVGGCTSSSKTFTAGMVAWAWVLRWGNPSRVITFAPTGRQVTMNLWGYIPMFYRAFKVPIGGELKQKMWYNAKHRETHYMTGFSSDDPHNVKGIHGKHDLIIIDDGQGIQQPMYDGLELTMASGQARVLILCNKDVRSGEVYDAYHSKRHLYNALTIDAESTPNVKAGKIIIEGMITKDQVEEWRKTYGENDDFYKIYVKGGFPSQEAKSVIPADWCEKAVSRDRWASGSTVVLGCDYAWQGTDDTALIAMRGLQMLSPTMYHGFDPMEASGLTIAEYKKLNASAAYGDVIGLGAGTVTRVKEQGFNMFAVNVAKKQEINGQPLDEDNQILGLPDFVSFANLRAKIWWLMRWALDPKNPDAIGLPNDDQLLEDLTAPRFRYHSEGKIMIEPKEETKKRLGRSPDKGDSACLANYGRIRHNIDSNTQLVRVA